MNKKISIVPPYVTDRKEIRLECNLDDTDVVERSGYVSPDKKIQSFIESGTLLQGIRTSGEEYDVQGGETDAESDSPEYVEELTQDAENYDGECMPQFIDKLSANDYVDNKLKESEAHSLAEDSDVQERKKAKQERKEFIDELSTSIAEKTKSTEKESENN